MKRIVLTVLLCAPLAIFIVWRLMTPIPSQSGPAGTNGEAFYMSAPGYDVEQGRR